MADAYGGTDDSGSRAAIHIALWQVTTDEGNNRVLCEYYVDVYDNNGSLGGYGTGSYSVWGSASASGSLTYDFTGNSGRSYRVAGGQFWVGMGADGRGSASISASFSGSSPVGNASAGLSISSDAGTMSNFYRPPYAPGAPSLTRSSDGGTIYITSQAADGRGLTVTDYNWCYSADGSNWSGALGMGTSRYATFGCTTTQGYYIRTRAYTSEGWGDWSAATYIQGVPSVPASITVARTGRNVTVTSGSASGTVAAYYVEYSLNGSTFSNTQLMSSQSFTYSNLTPGLNYWFRVYAVNAIGYGAPTVSNVLYVPAGGYVANGSSEVSAQAYIWNGTAEVPVLTAAYWDGTQERPLG